MNAPRRTSLSAEVKDFKGSPAIFVNGAPTNPLMFFGWAESPFYSEQVWLAKQAGVRIYSFGISLPWPEPGQEADFSQTDAAINATLAANPEALLLMRFETGPPDWWLEQHPDDRMLFDDGKTQGWSMASTSWRREMLERLKILVRHCEEKYGDRILGYHPCGQETGEWFYFRTWEPRLSDFSPAMNRGFADYVKVKYQTEDSLRLAWNNPLITFGQVAVPSPVEQLHTDLGFFRDPQTEAKVIDYFEYKQTAMEEPLEQIARAIKEETAGAKLVCFFYGYTFEMHGLPLGPQGSGHLAMAKLVHCPDVDILCAPVSYVDRGLGGAGYFMSAVDTVRSGGKLWLNEDDTRTYLSDPDSNFGRVGTPLETFWVHQRNFAQLWPRRLACWYMDLGGTGWLAGMDIWENIARLNQFYGLHQDEAARWEPDVALIVDEVSPFSTACTSVLHSPLVYQTRRDFFHMGTSFSIHLLIDLVEGRVPPAKVYFFLNCFRLDSGQRAAILRYLRGRTAVWFYGGGFLAENADDGNISAATGISVVRSSPQPGKVTPETAGAFFGEGLADSFGTSAVLDPLWAVKDERAEVVGRYPNGEVAAAAKRTPAGLRIYIGALQCPAKLLRNILRLSGVHIYCDSDDVVLTDGRFLAFVAASAGSKHLSFQDRCLVVDVLDGRTIAHGVDSLDLEMAQGETRLFLLIRARG